MQRNEVWDLVKLPEGWKPVSCKWVIKSKWNSDRVLEGYKDRLVAQGFTQKHGRTKHIGIRLSFSTSTGE